MSSGYHVDKTSLIRFSTVPFRDNPQRLQAYLRLTQNLSVST